MSKPQIMCLKKKRKTKRKEGETYINKFQQWAELQRVSCEHVPSDPHA